MEEGTAKMYVTLTVGRKPFARPRSFANFETDSLYEIFIQTHFDFPFAAPAMV